MKKLLLLAMCGATSFAEAKSVPLSVVLKSLGAEAGAPANYFSDEVQLEYKPTLRTGDDRLRTFSLDAHRDVGKKYINGTTVTFRFNQLDMLAAQTGIKMTMDTAFMCLQMSKKDMYAIWEWIAEKTTQGVTTTGGTFRKNFGVYQGGVDVQLQASGPLVMTSVWRLDKAAGSAKWANYCTIDGVLVY